ncbi:N-acetylmuramidase family protein [Marinomonas posidonica]|uniref:N-acetylmuramidase family protein n=1 Tax=Marinomonas posidonica TaxID=936476 RepID=UPI00373560BF
MSKLTLSSSVGIGGENQTDDVLVVQKALNAIYEKIELSEPLAEDGEIGEDETDSPTCQAITLLQRHLLGFKNPDALISCNGMTHKALKKALVESEPILSMFLPKIVPEKDLKEADFEQAAELLSCDVAAIKAVSEVESSGSGYFKNNAPCILFEAHQFSKYSGHRFDESHPDISSPKWDRSLYVGGEKEYERLQKAMELDRSAALKSASFGRYQIMGFNHEAAGYEDVESFVSDMFFAERHHLIAFVHFIKSNNRLLEAIQNLDWSTFARYYNGPSYAENHYDEKLQSAYEKHNAEQ